MANIQEKIAKLFPAATFENDNSGILQITVADEQWHELAKTLRDDPDTAMDYLVTIVGMDWVEKLGCIYYLMSTRHNTMCSVKVAVTDRDKPYIHSVADLWRIAEIYEREVYDFYGIVFINNPDMRRLFLNIDWVGYPLRKDYDEDPAINPVSIENERQTDLTSVYKEEGGKVVKTEREIFHKDDFVVNIGPQHPATHGVLRFRTAVDGETIKKIDVYMGYITAAWRSSASRSSIPRHFISSTVSTTSRVRSIITVCACSTRRPSTSRYRAVPR